MPVPFTLFTKNIYQYVIAYFTFCVVAIANALLDFMSNNKPEQNHMVNHFFFGKFTMGVRLQGNTIPQATPYKCDYQKLYFGFAYTKKHVFYYLT